MGLFHPSRITHRWLAAVVVAGATLLGGPLTALAAWPQFQGEGSHDGVIDGPTAPLKIAWRRSGIELEGPNTTGGLSSPVVADDGTIVVVAPTAVLGLSPSDGSESFSAERDFGPSSQPAIAEGPEGPTVVYTEGFGDNPPVGSATPSPSPASAAAGEEFDSHVNAVDLATGETVWRSAVPLEDVVQTPVAVDREAAYVGDVGGTVTAIDLGSGQVRWTAELDTPISGAVTLDGDRAYVATLGTRSTPGVVAALETSTGEEVWRTGEDAIASNVVSAVVLADARLLVLESTAIVALDPDEGRLLWQTEVVNPRRTPFVAVGVGAPAPVSADGQVFAVDETGRAYALDAETGEQLWDFALNDSSPVSPPLLTDRHVLVPTDSGTLYALDRARGHLVWRSAPVARLLRGLADGGDVLVGVSGLDDAGVAAFEEDPDGSLIDEPSPTTFDLGRLLAGFGVGALSAGLVAMLFARPLQRRLGPAFETRPLPSEDDLE